LERVGETADSLRFPDEQHFARYFRAGKKISRWRTAGSLAPAPPPIHSRKAVICFRKMALRMPSPVLKLSWKST
jgi:hypothetical protein